MCIYQLIVTQLNKAFVIERRPRKFQLISEERFYTVFHTNYKWTFSIWARKLEFSGKEILQKKIFLWSSAERQIGQWKIPWGTEKMTNQWKELFASSKQHFLDFCRKISSRWLRLTLIMKGLVKLQVRNFSLVREGQFCSKNRIWWCHLCYSYYFGFFLQIFVELEFTSTINTLTIN